MKKVNCWEFMKCGKGPGEGDKNMKNGTCPVAREKSADGLNEGTNGGRICWMLAGNNRDDSLGCSRSKSILSCFSCDFHLKVRKEEGLRKVCHSVGAVFHGRKEKGTGTYWVLPGPYNSACIE